MFNYEKSATVKNKTYFTAALRDPFKISSILGQRYFGRDNLYIPVATYRNGVSFSYENLASINAICIDVDYRNSYNKNIFSLSAIEAMRMFYSDLVLSYHIPRPTYIEYGRNFRLVYILDQPFFISKKKSVRQKCIRLIHRIGTLLGKAIMKQGEWAVDSFKVAPFVRVPESINLKKDNNSGHLESYEVSIFKTGCPWDFTKLCEAVLPDLPKSKKEKKVKTYSPHSTEKLLLQRLEDLKTYQKHLGENDIGYREFMVFLFLLTAVQVGNDEKTALDLAKIFNNQFVHPLLLVQVEKSCKPKKYNIKYCNSTIRDFLDCPYNLHLFEGNGLTNKEKYAIRKEKNS